MWADSSHLQSLGNGASARPGRPKPPPPPPADSGLQASMRSQPQSQPYSGVSPATGSTCEVDTTQLASEKRAEDAAKKMRNDELRTHDGQTNMSVDEVDCTNMSISTLRFDWRGFLEQRKQRWGYDIRGNGVRRFIYERHPTAIGFDRKPMMSWVVERHDEVHVVIQDKKIVLFEGPKPKRQLLTRLVLQDGSVRGNWFIDPYTELDIRAETTDDAMQAFGAYDGEFKKWRADLRHSRNWGWRQMREDDKTFKDDVARFLSRRGIVWCRDNSGGETVSKLEHLVQDLVFFNRKLHIFSLHRDVQLSWEQFLREQFLVGGGKGSPAPFKPPSSSRPTASAGSEASRWMEDIGLVLLQVREFLTQLYCKDCQDFLVDWEIVGAFQFRCDACKSTIPCADLETDLNQAKQMLQSCTRNDVVHLQQELRDTLESAVASRGNCRSIKKLKMLLTQYFTQKISKEDLEAINTVGDGSNERLDVSGASTRPSNLEVVWFSGKLWTLHARALDKLKADPPADRKVTVQRLPLVPRLEPHGTEYKPFFEFFESWSRAHLIDDEDNTFRGVCAAVPGGADPIVCDDALEKSPHVVCASACNPGASESASSGYAADTSTPSPEPMVAACNPATWEKYLTEDGNHTWWYRQKDGAWFSEAEPGLWTRYRDQNDRIYWYASDEKWFYVDSGSML